MKLKADSFPYPVLSPATNDYIDSSFVVEIESKVIDENIVEIQADFTLNNLELQGLVESGVARFVLHLEGKNSSYRTYFMSELGTNQVLGSLNIEETNQRLEVNALLVANEHISEFSSTDFNPIFYSDFKIKDIHKGQILAFDLTYNLNLEFSNKEKQDGTPPMEFRASKNQYMTYNFENDDIIVELPEKSFNIYTTLSNSIEAQRNLLLVAFVLPALTQAISILQNEPGNDNKWEEIIVNKLVDCGVDADKFKNNPPEMLAQLILANPLDEVLTNYSRYDNREDGQ